MSRSRILFVDDEPNIINGLRRVFWPLREEYEAVFANSGREALELFDAPFDIVVSDMRMPGMDGVEFLRRVRASAPDTIRVILSGYAEQHQVAAGMMVAHQYLSKPCPPEQLRAVVTGAVRLQSLLRGAALRSLVAQIDSLPPLPHIHEAIITELETESPSLDRVATLIERDPAIAAKVLQLGHSAYWVRRQAAPTVRDCVQLLGLETTSKIVLSAEAFVSCGGSPFIVDELWSHSERVALAARATSERLRPTDNRAEADLAYIGGLLHDVGRIVLASRFGAQYDAFVVEVDPDGDSLEAERAAFGATHQEIGGYLLGLWGLPTRVIEAAAYHHGPADLCGATGVEPHASLLAIALADASDDPNAATRARLVAGVAAALP